MSEYDVIVVGGGPSGAFAVKELTAQKLKVCMVEAGPRIGPADFDKRRKPSQSAINLGQRAIATLRGQPIQSRSTFFSDRLSGMYVNDRKNPYTTPRDAPFNWMRGRQAGGRSHTYGRVLLRWTDDDFKLNARTGRGVDWPISYEDVAPFYDEVEETLGLYGNPDGVKTLPDGRYVGAALLTPAEAAFKAAVESRWPRRNVVTWRYTAPNPTRVLRPMRDALDSGHLSVMYNAIVRRVSTDEATGRATGVEVIDTSTREVKTLMASAVVLCASPIESVRIMLNSASASHPDGLGNSSGVLGRYFMDQLPSIASGRFAKVKGGGPADLAPEDQIYGRSGGVYVPRYESADRASADSNFAFQGTIGRALQSDTEDAIWSFKGFGMMLPNPDNRITLDPKRVDHWGIPVPHIACRISDADRQTLRAEVGAIKELMEQAGGSIDFVGSPLGLEEFGRGAFPEADFFSRMAFRTMFSRVMVMGNSIHESGGARMGASPTESVLNQFNQSWDVPNLFVTDASAFAGSGVAGTTLTIMALSVRACRYLAKNLRAGTL